MKTHVRTEGRAHHPATLLVGDGMLWQLILQDKYLYIIIFTHSGTDHDICGANAYFPVGKISI
jgi:hypothetical protein